MIRDEIKTALVSAMKSGDKVGVGTMRMLQSAIKNRDIELRTASVQPDDDALASCNLKCNTPKIFDSITL